MSDDYKQGFKDGWKDGYDEAMRTVQRSLPLGGQHPPIPKPVCPLCGITWDKPMGYVCPNAMCPTKVTYG